MRLGFGRGESAVSDVIGTVLLLGITVGAFSVLSVAVLDQFERTPPPARIEFRVDTVGERTSITAVWGESIAVSDTTLIYEVNDARTVRNLVDAPLAGNLLHRIPSSSGTWDVGETIRLACPVSGTCAHPGLRVTNVSVLQRLSNTVLFSSETGVARGSVLNPVADLVLTVDSIRDPLLTPADPLYNGGTIEVKTKIRNDGVLAVPSDRTLTTTFFLDGSSTPFYTSMQTGGLAPGASYFVTTPAFSASVGTHALRVAVSPTPSLIEAGLGNNEVLRTLTIVAGVFDPGAPFEDGNDDVLYNPYVASDSLLAAAAVLDGVHTASAGKGLVVPPSTGGIVTAGSMSFSAPTGRLTIRVGLETTNSGASITLNGQTGLNVTGAFDLKTRDDLTMTSASQIDISGTRLDSNNDDIVITSSGGRVLAVDTSFFIAGLGSLPDDVRITSGGGGAVYLAGADFDAGGFVRISPAGVLYAQNAIVKAASTISYDMAAASTVYVAGSSLDDSDNCADVDPSSVTIQGVPIFGRVETSC